MYKTTLSGQVWRFDSLKTLLAKASPARSGDALAGIIAESAEERMAAKMALAEVPHRSGGVQAAMDYLVAARANQARNAAE